MEHPTNHVATLREQVSIQRAIGERQRLAEVQARFFCSPDGRRELERQGRLLELLFTRAP